MKVKLGVRVAEPSINEVLAEFLAQEQRRLAPRTFRRYEEVIGLLRDCLDNYAYESLPATERTFWEKRYEADEAAGSYCNTFGPQKIPGELGSFLGYFMIRKVLGGADLKRAAGTVTGKLVAWLAEKGYIGPEDTADALERTSDAARDLPRAATDRASGDSEGSRKRAGIRAHPLAEPERRPGRALLLGRRAPRTTVGGNEGDVILKRRRLRGPGDGDTEPKAGLSMISAPAGSPS